MERLSPEKSATLYEVGTIKTGNDSKKWIVSLTSNNVKRWTRYIKPNKRFYIHDNGSVPFKVSIYDDSIKIESTNINKKFIKSNIKYEKYFAVKDLNYNYVGTTVLIKTKLKTKYIYVGTSIYEFNTIGDDEIVKYYSNVGNSDVSYPIAVGKKYIYFMLDKVGVPIEIFAGYKNISEAYGLFYGFEKKYIEMYKKILMNKKKIPNIKLLI